MIQRQSRREPESHCIWCGVQASACRCGACDYADRKHECTGPIEDGVCERHATFTDPRSNDPTVRTVPNGFSGWSDLDALRELLCRFGLAFEVDKPQPRDEPWVPKGTAWMLDLQNFGRSPSSSVGYGSFFGRFFFSDAGEFLGVGFYE